MTHITAASPSRRQVLAAALCLSGALLATPARALEVAGTPVPESVTVAGKPLVLNGAGVRYKAMFKVYVAALYVPQKTSSVAEAWSTDTPKRLRLVMLRDIDSTELGNMFARGMEENAERGSMVKLLPGIMRMSQIFTDYKRMVPGNSIQMDWVPGTGCVLTVNGKLEGEPFREPEFFRGLLSIWLGQKPADWKLKDALLGKEG
ncbi:hypothetical protein FVQ98_11270 [Ottowia sp. GY511]|uniref:Chalcone isomerase family protein n=1 Tax=Ottowia flava TaxID=2675430 RepID=A0ABW4KZ86_9BURK|nr:chalcone isomerase family protein [Ottowia sp. GY511]TXK27254.1 hypothetical protein FVQ98_11270 [Ottowia sp. GY511]